MIFNKEKIMKKKSLLVLTLLFLIFAATAGAQKVDYGKFVPALTPAELGVSAYHFSREGTLLSIEIYGRSRAPKATMSVEWPGDMAGHITFRSQEANLSAVWHVDTGVLETEDLMTGEGVVFRPSGSMEEQEARWEIEGAARSVDEVRKGNRRAIELMLHAYDEAVTQLNLRPRQDPPPTVGQDLLDKSALIDCTTCSGSCPPTQTTATTRSRCCAAAFGISSASCPSPACASSLCISNCAIGNSLCLCTLNAIYEIDFGPGPGCDGDEWPPACV